MLWAALFEIAFPRLLGRGVGDPLDVLAYAVGALLAHCIALTVDTDNPALKARAEEVTRLRAENKPTIPVLLGEEKKANVFLRADEPSVALKLHMKGASAAEVFGELRERKNKS